MGKTQMTAREKELLTILGEYPGISMKELVIRTQYKRISSVIKKLEQFRERGMIYGPIHTIDYGKLCKNPFCQLFCIIEFAQSFETVVEYLKLIEPLWVVYPVLSSHKELIIAAFFSSDNAETKSLLQLLKDTNIITDYTTRVYSHKRVIENPNFFGDYNPSLDNLLDPCDIPDLSFGCHDTNWSECDISILPYLQVGYKDGKLIEILRAEKKLNKPWTYHQVKYSRKKMVRNGLIEKKYLIFPFSFDQCVDFNLFLNTGDTDMTRRILHNFARESRVTREYVLCEDWGYVGFASHPRFLTGLMHRLDKIDEIKEKELYQLRSSSDRAFFFQPSELKYFDFDEQTLEYPYHVYKEKIKEKIDERDR